MDYAPCPEHAPIWEPGCPFCEANHEWWCRLQENLWREREEKNPKRSEEDKK